jgi:hypothetical protein
MKRFTPAAMCCLIVALSACSEDRHQVDTSAVEYSAEFLRLDQAIFESPDNLNSMEIAMLEKQYGTFLPVYFTSIMQMPPPDNPMLPEFLTRFTEDPIWQQLQTDIEMAYPDLSAQQEKLEGALKSYAVHFNEDSLPRLVAYNSGFNVGIYPSDEWLGVGLEWYLSPDNEVVKRLPPDLFPQYKRNKMKPEYLVVNALKGWLFFKFRDRQEEDMLGNMVFSGKMLYITKALMDVNNADLLNYSPAQLEWTEDSEYAIWTYLLENDLVFSTDFRQINKMMNDGPFTPGMPPESPGGVGNWLGLQMVEAFMKENDKLTLQDLIKADKRRILEHYKPGK